MSGGVSAGRAAFLLTRLRLRRQFNQIVTVSRYRLKSADRKVASRSPVSWLIGIFVIVFMTFGCLLLCYQAVDHLDDAFTGLPAAPGSVLPVPIAQGVSFASTSLLLCALLIAAGSRELSRPDWDLEWLVTLPLPTSTLLVSRLVERALTNSAGFLLIVPFLTVVAWRCGYRIGAPLLGLGLGAVLLLLVASVQLVIDTGLRMSLAPSRLRNLQAVMLVLCNAPLLAAMAMAYPDSSKYIIALLPVLPAWIQWLPTGLLVHSLASIHAGDAIRDIAIMIAETLLVSALSLAWLQLRLRDGVVAAGTREGVARRRQRLSTRSGPALPAGWLHLSVLTPVQRRELVLLRRDRTFMIQTLLMPVIIAFMPLFFNGGSSLFAGAGSSNLTLLVAFGLATYMLMFSAFQALNAEGGALWVLYTVPRSLESVLWQKAKLWAAVALFYAVATLGMGLVLARHASPSFIAGVAVVLVGIPIFALIATALGVFGCDPLAPEVQRKVKITYVYLYMTLAGFYGSAIYSPDAWQRIAVITLSALVAIALWQKARDQFDYLLDPAAAPPHRVAVSDGLIAALMFFVVQALVFLLCAQFSPASGWSIWIAFCTAGAVTYSIMRLVYWRARTAGVPALLGPDIPRALLLGMTGGIAASVTGIAYLEIVRAFNLFPAVGSAETMADPTLPLWLGSLAVILAPIFEEFIFRGLIFGGLRRLLNAAGAALASAAIFAIVHPPMSVIPVFVMGICAALVYERAKMLAAPMLVHAIYNAVILGFQWAEIGR